MPALTRPASAEDQPAVHWTFPGKKTFALQASLPHLPLPTLDETLVRFLRSCARLLSASELETTARLVEEFRTGEGLELQSLLEARAAACGPHRSAPHVHWLEEW